MSDPCAAPPWAWWPDWSRPSSVRLLQTVRAGGVSPTPFDSFNLGRHVGDDPVCVAANRQRLLALVPSPPQWLQQVHGRRVLPLPAPSGIPEAADAAWTGQAGVVCAVMTADCLPVVFCDLSGTRVAAAHAGWRGLADGVLEATVMALDVPPGDLLAWLGPCIGPGAFEVGPEVRARFLAIAAEAGQAFSPGPSGSDRWLADLPLLATQALRRCGVLQITPSRTCTWSDPERFYSYRRDGAATGRMATLVWLQS